MNYYRWICSLSLFGILLSGYSLYAHYSSSASEICNWSASVSCDLVNKSPYSNFFGIPVALIGLGGYVLLAVLSFITARGRTAHGDIVAFAGVGLLFSLYLTGIEAFVLHVWCPVCVLSQVVVLTIFVLSWIGYKRRSSTLI